LSFNGRNEANNQPLTFIFRRALKLTREMLALSPDHPRGHGNLQYYEQTLKKKGASFEKRGEDGLGDADETVNVLKVKTTWCMM
jgi:hypothetical protein